MMIRVVLLSTLLADQADLAKVPEYYPHIKHKVSLKSRHFWGKRQQALLAEGF